MALDTWLAFFLASWIISLSPGAGAIASMSSGLQYGFVRGYWNAIGLQLGLAMQIAVVAGGLGGIIYRVLCDQMVRRGLPRVPGHQAMARLAHGHDR